MSAISCVKIGPKNCQLFIIGQLSSVLRFLKASQNLIGRSKKLKLLVSMMSDKY